MSRTIVAPLLGFIFVTLSLVFKIDIDEATKQEITLWVSDGFALGFILYGIVKSHKKKVDKIPKKG